MYSTSLHYCTVVQCTVQRSLQYYHSVITAQRFTTIHFHVSYMTVVTVSHHADDRAYDRLALLVDKTVRSSFPLS